MTEEGSEEGEILEEVVLIEDPTSPGLRGAGIFLQDQGLEKEVQDPIFQPQG